MLVVEDCLPSAMYRGLAETYPAVPVQKPKHPVLCSPAWYKFLGRHISLEWWDEVREFWDASIAETHRKLNYGNWTIGVRQPGREKNPENSTADIMLDCYPLVRQWLRPPHLDKPGRLLIPASFRAACRLTERVAFVGLDADRFQLWHPDDLDESFRGVRDSAAELLAHLAELGV